MEIRWLVTLVGIALGGVLTAVVIFIPELAILGGVISGGILAVMVIFIPKFLAKKRIKEGRYCKTCAYYVKHTGYCVSPKLYKEFDPELGEYKRPKVFAMRNYNTWNCKWKDGDAE